MERSDTHRSRAKTAWVSLRSAHPTHCLIGTILEERGTTLSPRPLPEGRGSCSAYGSPPAPAGDCWRFPKLRTVPSPFRERELFGARKPTSAIRRPLALPQTQDRPLSLQGEGAVRRREAHQPQPATAGASPNSGPSLSLHGEGAVRRTEAHQRQPATTGASPNSGPSLSLQGEGAVRRTEAHQRQPVTAGASPNSGPSPSPFRERELFGVGKPTSASRQLLTVPQTQDRPSPFRERELFGVRKPTSASRRLLALPQTQDRPLSLQGEG